MEVIYEGYGPSGVAVLCEALTDNRNRTAGELRKAFEVCGGNLGASGCVSYLFNYKGLFIIDAKTVAEDRLMEVALEAGADEARRHSQHTQPQLRRPPGGAAGEVGQGRYDLILAVPVRREFDRYGGNGRRPDVRHYRMHAWR